MTDEKRARFWATLEALGEPDVRHKLRMGFWLKGSPNTAYAEEWIRSKDDARTEASSSANLRVARSAKNAAWLAAAMAIVAAIVAIVSAVIAYLALRPQ